MKFVGSIMFFFYMFSLLELEQIIVQLPVRCTDKFFILYLDKKKYNIERVHLFDYKISAKVLLN